MAERLRRGRHAQLRRGPTLALDARPLRLSARCRAPRDPSRVRLEAQPPWWSPWWRGLAPQPVSLDEVAKRLSEAQLPPQRVHAGMWPRSGASSAPVYLGIAASGRTRPAPARRRTSALQPVGPGQSEPPAQRTRGGRCRGGQHQPETCAAVPQRLDRNIPRARRPAHDRWY